MSDTPIDVFIDLPYSPGPVQAGRLWSHFRKGRESASFEYNREWLANPYRFALEPLLPLADGTFHTTPGQSVFGAIGDSTPDRWGRILMRRAELARARTANESPHTLSELDYLLMVNDEARQGALRFSQDGENRSAPLRVRRQFRLWSTCPVCCMPLIISAGTMKMPKTCGCSSLPVLPSVELVRRHR